MTRLGILHLSFLLLGVSGCSKPLSPAECSILLDHYVRLLMKQHDPKTQSHEIEAAQVEARRKAASDPAFSECSLRVSRSQLECAMAASNPDKLEQCLL